MKINVDWNWVKSSVIETEKIRPVAGDALFDLVHDLIDKAKRLAKPKVLLKNILIISMEDGHINLEGGSKLFSKILTSHLKGAKSLYPFLVTIGSALEDEASVLMKNGYSPDGYLLDRIGSFAVESLAFGLENLLRSEHELKDKSVSMRFSPGYCDWPMEEQAVLNKLLDFSKIDVSLTENFMMKPKKSISGLIGIGPANLFSVNKSQCGICNIKDCSYRRG